MADTKAVMATRGEADEVSFVIVTFNGSAWVRDCVRSALAQAGPLHVIVVDNASSDETAAIVRQEFPQVTLIESDRNLGFGRGNNLGIRAALERGSEYIFLLNQDAFMAEGALGVLKTHLQARPAVGVVAPLHCSPDLGHLDARTFRGYLQVHAFQWLDDAVHGRAEPGYAVFGVNAAGWLVRSATFRTCGGFDPLFFMYGEDDDLMSRWAHHGVRFELVPAARMVHLRQSPPLPVLRGWARIKQASERSRSAVLSEVKHPRNSTFHAWAVLLAEGFWKPVGNWLLRRDLSGLLHAWVGAARVAAIMGHVLRHQRLLRKQGAHFLEDISAPQPRDPLQ